jgi:hypothetical protein
MPERETVERAKRDKREGKAPSTQAGEFIREEMHHIREGKHGARSSKQAIAIGLSKARRAGVELKPPAEGKASPETRHKAQRDYARGHGAPKKRATGLSAGRRNALKKEGRSAASHQALSRQGKASAAKRSPEQRSGLRSYHFPGWVTNCSSCSLVASMLEPSSSRAYSRSPSSHQKK